MFDVGRIEIEREVIDTVEIDIVHNLIQRHMRLDADFGNTNKEYNIYAINLGIGRISNRYNVEGIIIDITTMLGDGAFTMVYMDDFI